MDLGIGMATVRRVVGAAAVLGGLAWNVGCGDGGDGLPRLAVSGNVTLNGRPLERGRISFEPISNDAGTQVGSPILDGAFDVAREVGPVAGSYLVRIQGASEGGDPDDQSKKYKVQADPVPAHYNTSSELQAEVKAGGGNTFDFELTSKAK